MSLSVWHVLRQMPMRALARLGWWRGQWRRGRVTIDSSAWLPGMRAHRNWRYGLYIPAGLRDDQPAPLVVLLHGCHQRALNFAEASGWTAQADRARLRLLCPSQRRLSNLFRCWNWFDARCQRGRGEVDVLLAMLDDASRQVAVEAGSVAAVGVSAGGAMAALLAFRHPDRIGAAVAVAAPPLLGDFTLHDPRLVMKHGLASDPALALGTSRQACAPLAIIHGQRDDVVSPRCGAQLLAQAAESLRRAGVDTRRSESDDPTLQAHVTDYASPQGPLLRLVEIAGLGHAWTGGPGGHAYCETDGPPLTALCARFLRDAGLGRAAAGSEEDARRAV